MLRQVKILRFVFVLNFTFDKTLLRTLLHGGYDSILGTEDGIASGGNWNDVSVVPSERVFMAHTTEPAA